MDCSELTVGLPLLHILLLRDAATEQANTISLVIELVIVMHMRDSRKEGSAAVCAGSVLEVHAEVVPADEGLETRPEVRAPVVLPELDGLVHPAVPVAGVGGEG